MTFSIDEFVGDCLGALHEAEGSQAVAVKDVLERAISAPAPILATVGSLVDTPVFTTWHNSDELTVLHVIWPPTVDLMPHDHRMWAAIGLYGGREDNSFWRVLPEGNLEKRSDKTMLEGDALVLGDDTVHSVANPSSEWTGAIHVYGGDFFTSGRRMWPDSEGQCIDFDVNITTEVIEAAADRARLLADD